MIGAIRSLFDSWLGRLIALAFVILVGLAFALSDVSGTLGGGPSSSTMAKVGGETITSSEFRQAVEFQHRQMRQQNPSLDVATFIRQGGADQVLEQLVNSFAIAGFGEKSDMGASDRMVDTELATIPGVVDGAGKVNRTELQRFLTQQNLTEDMLRQSISQGFFAQQLLPMASYGLVMPTTLTKRYAAMNYESRSGRIAPIPAAAFAPKTPPSDAVLADFYKKNADKYTIPETRSIRYALFTQDIVGDKAKPTDKEISDYYAANADAYSASKVVSYEQVIVPTESVAKATQAKLASGASMDSVAAESKFAAIKDTAASEAILAGKSSADVAKAVFATPSGLIAPLKQSPLGWHVVRVTKVENRPARSLAEARTEINGILEADKREQVFGEITEDMQNRLEDGESLSVVAKDYGLTVETTPKILPMGINPKDPSYKPRAELAPIIGPAFQLSADDGGSLAEVEKGKRFALYSVAEIEEAAPPPLAQIKERVSRDWAMSEGNKQAKSAADKIVAGVKGGKTLEESVKSINAALPGIEPLAGTRQQLAEAGPDTPRALFTLFEMPIRGVRASEVGQNRGYFVIIVDKITPADIADNDARLAEFGAQYRAASEQELQQQFVAAMREDVGVETNTSAVNATKKQLTGDS